MAASLKVDVSIMPDFPTPPPHSSDGAGSSSSSSTASPSSSSSSSSTSSKARRLVVATPPPSASSLSSPSSAPSSTCPLGPDYDQNGHKIKRPMNAFMVWAQMRRAEITAVSSKVHNSTISKALGVEWREMSEDAKQPYVQKAKELRDELFREHPHYVYRPRKRKARAAPYSPRPALVAPPTTHNTSASLPAGSACSMLQCSTPPPSLTALLMPQQQLQLPLAAATQLQQQLQQHDVKPTAAQLAQPQMPLFSPQLLQQLQQQAALAAVMQQQQQQPQQAAMMNPLLLHLLNPLFTQMLTQMVTATSSPQ